MDTSRLDAALEPLQSLHNLGIDSEQPSLTATAGMKILIALEEIRDLLRDECERQNSSDTGTDSASDD